MPSRTRRSLLPLLALGLALATPAFAGGTAHVVYDDIDNTYHPHTPRASSAQGQGGGSVGGSAGGSAGGSSGGSAGGSGGGSGGSAVAGCVEGDDDDAYEDEKCETEDEGDGDPEHYESHDN